MESIIRFSLIYLLSGVVFVSVECARADEYACCPATTYVMSNACYDRENNVTTPMRLDNCVQTVQMYNFTVLDGVLEIVFNRDRKAIYSKDKSCYGNSTKNRDVKRVQPVALLCITEKEETEIVADSVLGYCMIASVLFLGLTAITYTAFGELRDLFGKSVINFTGSLAVGLAVLALMKLMAYRDMTACAIRGFSAYFFLLSAFFWTNSIAIQVLRDTRRPCTVMDYGWREFRWYALYSWGTPAALTACLAIVNYHPGDHQRPGIGLMHCWFFTKAQQWYYMYSVMSALLAVNVGIFAYVATMVWRHSFTSSHVQALKFKLSMTIRLIVLMGLPWIFEMISSASEGGQLIWAVVDVFNSLQGVLVFLVLVVFRKRVIKVIHNRGWLSCCSDAVEKHLAVGDDAEENVVQHTDVPMSDDHRGDGRLRA